LIFGEQCARADSAILDFWFLELDYGVFADGGNQSTAIQGPLAIDAPGEHSFNWSQEDGVAFAESTAHALLEIDEQPTHLQIGGYVATTATAIVGDDPDYPFEFATASAFVNTLLVSVELLESHWLSVSGSTVNEATLGSLEPGVYLLEPGPYDFSYDTGFGTGSRVEAFANESAFDSNQFDWGLDFVVPAPASLAVLMLPMVFRGRRRQRRGSARARQL
jgi:hypothetical protein